MAFQRPQKKRNISYMGKPDCAAGIQLKGPKRRAKMTAYVMLTGKLVAELGLNPEGEFYTLLVGTGDDRGAILLEPATKDEHDVMLRKNVSTGTTVEYIISSRLIPIPSEDRAFRRSACELERRPSGALKFVLPWASELSNDADDDLEEDL